MSSLPTCGNNNLEKQTCTELGGDQAVEEIIAGVPITSLQMFGVWWEGEQNGTRKKTLQGESVKNKSHSPVHQQALCCTSLV